MNALILVLLLSGIILTTCAETQFPPDQIADRNVKTTTSALSYTASNSTTTTTTSSSTWTSSIRDGKVHDLGLENWNRVLESYSFVLVLFHDGSNHDESTKISRQQRILVELSDEYQQQNRTTTRATVWKHLRIGFGRVNTRRHSDLRDLYAPVGARLGMGTEYYNWYFSKNMDPEKDMLNSETFMKENYDELPKFPSYFMLFRGYDVLEYMEDDAEMDISGTRVTANTESFSIVKLWLRQSLIKHVHLAMHDHVVAIGAESYHPILVETISPDAMIPSRHRIQNERREKYLSSRAMESINWEAADYLSQKHLQNQNNVGRNPSSIDRQLLESTSVEGEKQFYNFTMTNWNDFDFESDILHRISNLFQTYLTFAYSYENLWDDERKVREDIRTGYGPFLRILNDQVRDLLLSTFEDLKNGNTLFFTQADIPELERYFRTLCSDMVDPRRVSRIT
jgi:hypothetical protein